MQTSIPNKTKKQLVKKSHDRDARHLRFHFETTNECFLQFFAMAFLVDH